MRLSPAGWRRGLDAMARENLARKLQPLVVSRGSDAAQQIIQALFQDAGGGIRAAEAGHGFVR